MVSAPVQAITLVVERSDAAVAATPVQWAVGRLEDALAAAGIPVQTGDRLADSRTLLTIVGAGPGPPPARRARGGGGVTPPDPPESLPLAPAPYAGGAVTVATGTDPRGLTYALLELADRV